MNNESKDFFKRIVYPKCKDEECTNLRKWLDDYCEKHICKWKLGECIHRCENGSTLCKDHNYAIQKTQTDLIIENSDD